MKKTIWILISLILLFNAFAETEIIRTPLDVTLFNGTVSINTEDQDYSYNCMLNTTHYHTIIFSRDINKTMISQNFTDFKDMCKDIIISNQNITQRIDDILKDTNAYFDPYTKCMNEIVEYKSKVDYKTQYDDCNTQKNNLLNEKTQLTAEKLNCDNDKNRVTTDLKLCQDKKCYQRDNLIMYIVGAFVLGFVAQLLYKKFKSPKDLKDMGQGKDGLF